MYSGCNKAARKAQIAAIIIGAGLYIFLRERDLGRGETVVNPPVA